jgi:hypothetical protein
VAQWAATLAAEECEQCAAPVAAPVEALPALPDDVAAALRQEGRAGALAAQATLDALGVGEALYGAVAARLSEQPGTGPWWRRWWAVWRGGALVGARHAPAA